MAALAAILRAARPSYRDDADRLAFAVHAFMLSLGYKLTAAGEAADGDAPLDPQAPEVGPENWQGLPHGTYSFHYARAEAGGSASTSSPKQPAEGEEKKLGAMLVRASTAGDALAVAWCKGGSGDASTTSTSSYSSVAPVASIVLPFRDWLLVSSSSSDAAAAAPAPSSCSSSSSGGGGDPTARFKDLAKLEAHLKDALERGVGVEGEKKEEEEEGAAGGGVGGGGGRGPAPPPPGQQRCPRPPPPHPVPSIGLEDLYPPGLGPGMPGIAHPFPGGGGIPMPGGGRVGGGGGGGGGSQVGPDHPLFGSRHPGIRPPGGIGGHGSPVPGLPPGARWDPIGPPGTPGFLPDDFRPPPPPPGRGQGGGDPPFHPDIMPPGPGGPFSGSGGGGGGFGGGFV